MLLKIDLVFAKPWSVVGSLLNWLFGWSNFFAARVFLFLGVILGVSTFAISRQGPTELALSASIIAALLWTFFSLVINKVLQKLEAHQTDVLSEWHQLAIMWRVLLVVLAIATATPWPHSAAYGICVAGALYLATQNQLKRKSATTRMWQWVRKHRPRFGSAHSPSPQPT